MPTPDIVVQIKGVKTTVISAPTGSATRLVQLADVDATPLANGDVLTYISANGKFEFHAANGSGTFGVDQFARDNSNGAFSQANTANVTGQAAFNKANSAIAARGSSTNDAAAVGDIGEELITTVGSGSATSLATGVSKNVATISLTAGDWEVSGHVGFIAGGPTVTSAMAADLSPTANGAVGVDSGAYWTITVTLATSDATVFVIPTRRVSLATTTLYYLNAISNFSVSTLKAYGVIRARRMR